MTFKEMLKNLHSSFHGDNLDDFINTFLLVFKVNKDVLDMKVENKEDEQSVCLYCYKYFGINVFEI